MSNYQEAQEFYEAFLSRTWNYSYEVREGAAGSAKAEWEYDSVNTPPSQLKRKFISGLKEGADLLEKEGGYSGRRTAEAIREILEELSSIYSSDDDSDEIEEDDYSESSIREIAKEYDIALASQFVGESMTGGLGYEPTTSFSDTEYERAMQEQYSHYCLMAKSNIAKDSVGPFGADPMMKMFKEYVLDYCSDSKNKEHSGMKYFYDLTEDDLIIHQISMFSYMANMKNVVDIHHVTNNELHNAFNPESVALAIGLYTYFTIIVNKNYDAEDFNKLFVEAFVDYYNNFMARYMMLKMNGNSWKDEFKGALLSD